ncbi:hypothetical protein N7520_003181 [Penicillium odoratum]|uniref:uncharacterized protein n=1 Tax=Penicillium odoratum TaxID=1167516 RepID=UPI002548E3FE|nr:uncharacterized protein N7520_003181 [Penicillium odoratum]KAJ5772652.1 hypothetical protein N7520_003181 [Penicillium odoratum]
MEQSQKPECPFCAARFNHRSSLYRHMKKDCNSQSLRQKACTECVAKKTRCNLKRPICSRCSLRSVPCHYKNPEEFKSSETDCVDLNQPEAAVSEDVALTFQPQSLQSIFSPDLFDSFFTGLESLAITQTSGPAAPPQREENSEDFVSNEVEWDSPELVRAITPPLHHFESPSQTDAVALSNHSMELIFRVLRSWPRMLAEEFQLPPLFHSTHIAQRNTLPLPLANCITLTKMWHGRCGGADEIVRKTIIKELDSIATQFEIIDDTNLLAVLQAVVIYAIILLSPSTESQRPSADHNAIFHKVELLVCHVVHSGLFLQEERTQAIPSWEAWLHVTSKRRAVLSLYLLHWAYSVLHRVPCFDCGDLGFMPAPAAKVLWEAQTEQEWKTRYIHWLSRWSGRGYIQAEFGNIRPGVIMDARAEKWLEEADEFGFIMISILNATDFNPPSLKELAR